MNGLGSRNLMYVGMPILTCPSNQTSNIVCAGGNGEGVCGRDSGGPLVVPKSTSDSTAVVIGISSHKFGPCAQNPAAFASVVAQLNWIKKNSGIP